MGKHTQIRLKETPFGFPSHFISSDGYVYFDAVPRLELSKGLSESSDISKIRGQGALPFVIDISILKNREILKRFIKVSIVGDTFLSIALRS